MKLGQKKGYQKRTSTRLFEMQQKKIAKLFENKNLVFEINGKTK